MNYKNSDCAWQQYLELVGKRPESFLNPDPDGIVILTNPTEVRKAEKEIAENLENQGYPHQWSRAGIFYEDPWIIVARDVVRFPTGQPGTFHHIIMRGGINGVVVLPVFSGKIVLIRHFRNGLRNWSVEIPRGAPSKNLQPKENAIDEIRCEIGGRIAHIEYLGPMHNNNGMVSETMQAYYAELVEFGKPNKEEGIVDIKLVSPEECRQMISTGSITDVHTIVAFTLAQMKGFIE